MNLNEIINSVFDYIKSYLWQDVKKGPNGEIRLLNFYLNGDPLIVKLDPKKGDVIVENFLINFDKAMYLTLTESITYNFKKISFMYKDKKVSLFVESAFEDDKTREMVNRVLEVYDFIFEKFQSYSENMFGIRKRNVLSRGVYIITRQDIENLRFLKGLYVTKPDKIGRYLTSYGEDHVNRPLVCWWNKENELEVLYPTESGSWETFNVTKFVKTINDLISRTGGKEWISEDDVLENMDSIQELIYRLRIQLSKPNLPFLSSGSIEITGKEDKTNIMQELNNLEEQIKTLTLIRTFDRYVRDKAIMKLVALSLSSLQKEEGVVSGESILASNIRTVSKLGGGKAVYIGKDELNLVDLKSKVIVSVIQLPSGKKALLIEPLSD